MIQLQGVKIAIQEQGHFLFLTGNNNGSSKLCVLDKYMKFQALDLKYIYCKALKYKTFSNFQCIVHLSSVYVPF